MKPRILVAGIGNIFLGDDAFGCEALRLLLEHELPEGVTAVDFGIRSYDLAYAMMDGYDAVIMVDAVSRGEQPGTIFLIEPDLTGGDAHEVVNAHSMNPLHVLRMVESLGGMPPRLFLVGCEPLRFESDDDDTMVALGLSEPVEAAIPGAIAMVFAVVTKILSEHSTHESLYHTNPERSE